MAQNYKGFVEKYLPKQEDNGSTFVFSVGFKSVHGNACNGIYLRDGRSEYYELFTLDEEDKLYLFNKYKSKAAEQVKKENEELVSRKSKELTEVRLKLDKTEKELDDLTNRYLKYLDDIK